MPGESKALHKQLLKSERAVELTREEKRNNNQEKM